jgi:uncharacterized linocin/CFP29 family protein
MEILNREDAPFGAQVWNIIDTRMGEFLAKRLSTRSIVDFDSSATYDTDAVSTKQTSPISNKNGLSIETREPIKMIEVKKVFKLSKNVIEDIKRGIEDYEDGELAQAANEFATVENNIILHGLGKANIMGILDNKATQSMNVASTKEILGSVAKALGMFNEKFVEGPYKLMISSATLAKLYTEFFDGISVKTKLDDILGAGAFVISQDIGDDRALLISQRGGDFKFYSGLDVSIGYEKESKDAVELFLIETCAFRTLAPEAAIILNLQ